MGALVVRVMCLNCGAKPRSSGQRGLCWVCYSNPAVLARFDVLPKGRQEGHGVRVPTQYDRPTSALPGTVAKLEVLERRYEQGLYLWHPDDAQDDCDRVEASLSSIDYAGWAKNQPDRRQMFLAFLGRKRDYSLLHIPNDEDIDEDHGDQDDRA